MPELAEIETVRRNFLRGPFSILGERIVGYSATRGDLRWPLQPESDIRKAICGASIVGLDRRAKYLLLRLHQPRNALNSMNSAADLGSSPGSAKFGLPGAIVAAAQSSAQSSAETASPSSGEAAESSADSLDVSVSDSGDAAKETEALDGLCLFAAPLSPSQNACGRRPERVRTPPDGVGTDCVEEGSSLLASHLGDSSGVQPDESVSLGGAEAASSMERGPAGKKNQRAGKNAAAKKSGMKTAMKSGMKTAMKSGMKTAMKTVMKSGMKTSMKTAMKTAMKSGMKTAAKGSAKSAPKAHTGPVGTSAYITLAVHLGMSGQFTLQPRDYEYIFQIIVIPYSHYVLSLFRSRTDF